VLADRLNLLEVERETNPTVAAFVEAKRSKGDERDLAAAIDKYAKMLEYIIMVFNCCSIYL
jgi:hypothetical protein